MKDIFKVSKSVCHDIQSGKVAPEDLILTQTRTRHSRTWEIKRATKENKDDPSIVAKGKDLVALFKSAANHIETDKFAQLHSLQSFRVFSKTIPGMETAEHRTAIQSKIRKVASGIRNTLKTIGKGTHTLTSLSKPWKMVDSDYVLHEVVQKFSNLPANITHKLADVWKHSSTTLNFKEWLAYQKKSWEESGSSKDFPSWTVENRFDEKEKQAWQEAHPTETFTEEKFTEWKVSQYPPERILPEPLWLLKEDWEKHCQERKKEGHHPVSFKTWVQRTIDDRKKFYEDLTERTDGIFAARELDDESFRVIDSYMFEYRFKTAAAVDQDVYITRKEWESTHPADTSDEAFRDFLDHGQYDYFLEKNPLPFPPTFEEWKAGREEDMRKAWEASKTMIPFDVWKSQQRRDPIAPISFVRLDAEQRKAYLTGCAEGKLTRLDTPYSTEHEKTAHSGTGWVIFVIGPDDDLYCGSHIPGTFHHSSFLGDGAVMAAGEIKTSSDGTIVSISSKSGHYKPSTQENIAMLHWFEAKGVDLSKIKFRYFQADGKESPTITAQEYLDSM